MRPGQVIVLAAPVSYLSVRLRWSASVLRRLLRNWGVAIGVGLVALGSGAGAGFSGMAGWLIWPLAPLIDAAARPWPTALLETLAHSLLGGVLVLAMRPLLWSRSWAESERALPLGGAVKRASDLVLVALALLPLAVLYVFGLVSLVTLQHTLTNLQRQAAAATHPLLVARMALSLALSMIWGYLLLQAARRSTAIQPGRLPRRERLPSRLRPVGSLQALVLLPLLRGPAQRTLRLVQVSACVHGAALLGIALAPNFVAWGLAALGIATLALTARLDVVVEADFAELHAACAPLPIDTRRLGYARKSLALFPGWVAFSLLAVYIQLFPAHFYRPVLAFFIILAPCFSGMLVMKINLRSSTRVAFWLFAAVTLLVLASESTP